MSASREIDEYSWVFFLKTHESLTLNQSFDRREVVFKLLFDKICDTFVKFSELCPTNLQSLTERFIEEFISYEAFEFVEDEFAGTYFKFSPSNYKVYRKDSLESNYIYELASKVGDKLFRDAFSAFQERLTHDSIDETGADVAAAPASDRIVTLSDNQESDLEQASTELINAVGFENAIDGDPTLRDRVLGQLRAGRELVRAKTLNAYLLYQTLMSLLASLIEKYKDHALGHAAKKLLDLLIEHIFGK